MDFKKCFDYFFGNNKTNKEGSDDSANQSTKNNTISEPDQFYLNTPLYKVYKIVPANEVSIINIEFYIGTLDAFCLRCDKISTFKSLKNLPEVRAENFFHFYIPANTLELLNKFNDGLVSIAENSNIGIVYRNYNIKEYVYRDRIIINVFECQRCNNEHLHFVLRVSNNEFEKIGQYPSIASLNDNHLKKYRKILGDEKYKELSKAIGLHSHDVGIGAFVYLRRIFEYLIIKAFNELDIENRIDLEEFKKMRMEDKIDYLKDVLPGSLVKNQSIYSILSLGIHELSEDVCLDNFIIVQNGIELILDDETSRKENIQKSKEISKKINTLNSRLN